MIIRILRKLRRKKATGQMDHVSEPSSNVGEPLGGRNWYKAKQKKPPVNAPRHVLD